MYPWHVDIVRRRIFGRKSWKRWRMVEVCTIGWWNQWVWDVSAIARKRRRKSVARRTVHV